MGGPGPVRHDHDIGMHVVVSAQTGGAATAWAAARTRARSSPWRRRGTTKGHLPPGQLAVPSEDRVGGHDGRDLPQDPSAESATVRREASALVVGEPGAAPLHLLFQDAVFRHQVLDDVLLMAVDPSREGHEQHLQG